MLFVTFVAAEMTTNAESVVPDTQPTASTSAAPELTTTWTRGATLHLLQLVKVAHTHLTDKVTKNRQVWKEIAAEMQQHLPGVSDGQCDQKWRNVKQHFKKYCDNQKKTGRARMNRPEFYDEIHEIVGSSHIIQPLLTTETLSTASSTDVAAPSETAETETSTIPAAVEASAPTTEATTRTRKCIRPITARERMEKKIDAMMEKQDAIITHL